MPKPFTPSSTDLTNMIAPAMKKCDASIEQAKMRESESRRAIVRFGKRHISILCPIGHLIEAHELNRNFGGSAFAAEIAFRHEGDRFDRLARKCDGAGH